GGGSGDWVNDYREVTTYSPNSSNPTSETVTAQDWDPVAGDWVNRDRGVFTQNSATEFVQLEQDWDPAANGGQGDWVNRDQEIITLNSNGEFVELVSQTWDAGQGAWVNEERGTFVYNSDGLIVENTSQLWDGTQWVNEFRLLQMYEEFTGTSVEETPGSAFTLEANYPNPFRDETEIRYKVASTQHVILEVFDMLGRRVMTLVDGTATTGSHTVTLDATQLAGGLYVYRLQGDNARLSRTMLVVK
ncbi:MAG: T9SS type A sorting domain-containing protein, partial [Rhodothermales bacterium]|nr:T9SS type A sorting domain-containing protein [Rhodothermales bacterium]